MRFGVLPSSQYSILRGLFFSRPPFPTQSTQWPPPSMLLNQRPANVCSAPLRAICKGRAEEGGKRVLTYLFILSLCHTRHSRETKMHFRVPPAGHCTAVCYISYTVALPAVNRPLQDKAIHPSHFPANEWRRFLCTQARIHTHTHTAG